MKISAWRRMRRWWHVRLRGLTAPAAEDLMDGIDLGDHDCGFSAWPRFAPPPEKPLGVERRTDHTN